MIGLKTFFPFLETLVRQFFHKLPNEVNYISIVLWSHDDKNVGEKLSEH